MDLTDPSAPALFSPEIVQELQAAERDDKRFTLERVPADKRAAVRVLASRPGWNIKAIAGVVHLAWETVSAIIDEDQLEIAEARQRMPRKLRRLVMDLLEHAHKNLHKLEPGEISSLFKTTYEAMCNEEGRASQITEKRVLEAKVAVPFAQGFDAFIRRLETEPPGNPIREKNEAPETHLADGNKFLPAFGAGDPAAVLDVAAVKVPAPETDLESDVSGPDPKETANNATSFATIQDPDLPGFQTSGSPGNSREADPPRGGPGGRQCGRGGRLI